MKNPLAVFALAAALLLATGFASAAEPEQIQAQDQTQAPDQMQPPAQPSAQPPVQKQERAYNIELQTGEERAAFRKKMRGAKSDAEREKLRKEHHEQMVERAKALRVPLYEEATDEGGMAPGGSTNER